MKIMQVLVVTLAAAFAGCGDDTGNDAPVCGNNAVETGEVCDDGNTTGGDGCSADCKSDETCGNSTVDSTTEEVCDDGNNTEGDGCSADCKSDESCGNNIVDNVTQEQCDDGNEVSGDGCSDMCEKEVVFYWAEGQSGIWRAGEGGANKTKIINTGGFAVAVAAELGFVFFDNGNGIWRADLDGQNATQILPNDSAYGLAVDEVNGRIYWSDFAANQVYAANTDGSTRITIVSVSDPSGLTVDPANNRVFVINYNNTLIIRTDLLGNVANTKTIGTNLGGQGIAIQTNPADGKIYFTTRGSDIWVADGTADTISPTKLIEGESNAHGLAIDAANNKLYWLAVGTQQLRMSNLDGTGAADVSAIGTSAWHMSLAK